MKNSMNYSLAAETRDKTETQNNSEMGERVMLEDERVILTAPPDTFPSFQELLSQQNIDIKSIAVQSNIAVQGKTPQEISVNNIEIPFPVPTPTSSPLLATQIFSILSPTATPLVAIETPTFPEPPPSLPPLPPLPVMPALALTETHVVDADTPDDLLQITGITPIIQQLLEEVGIVSYRQIIAWSDADTERLGSVSLTIMPRMRRFDWQTQARDLYEEKYG
jgi:hypothetical protein